MNIKLIILADLLDSKGFYQEANILDRIILSNYTLSFDEEENIIHNIKNMSDVNQVENYLRTKNSTLRDAENQKLFLIADLADILFKAEDEKEKANKLREFVELILNRF